jgi:hypothetical protein
MIRALVLAGLLLVPPVASAAFPDVPEGYGSRRAVEYLQREDVLRGYPDGLFRPGATINRAEFLKVLVAAKGIVPDPAYARCFPDVGAQWFAPYVCYAAAVGWVQGYPDGTFGPDRPVSFAEALKMLVNVRGYPQAPAEESERRGIDPSSWFAPYLTTALLIDVVSYEQAWGDAAIPLQSALTRGFVAQLLYRSLLAEAALSFPLDVSSCALIPSSIEIKTYVDVVLPSRTNVFRQELRARTASGETCVLATDANPFGRVTPAFDPYFLQPYPGGQPADSWTASAPVSGGRAVLRGGALGAGFRQEVFLVDLSSAVLRQLPSVFASSGDSVLSPDGRYIVYVGSAGRTIEALDLSGGMSAVLDSVQAPLTFLSSERGAADVTVSSSGATVASYAVYDADVRTATGYVLRERRTVDVRSGFAAWPPFGTPPEQSPSEGNPNPVEGNQVDGSPVMP